MTEFVHVDICRGFIFCLNIGSDIDSSACAGEAIPNFKYFLWEKVPSCCCTELIDYFTWM